jgi:hypothetical protein
MGDFIFFQTVFTLGVIFLDVLFHVSDNVLILVLLSADLPMCFL